MPNENRMILVRGRGEYTCGILHQKKTNDLYLVHHGILGQKWGVRRFQNEDMSLTPAGRKRYSTDVEGASKKYEKAKSEYNSFNQFGNLDAYKKVQNNLKWAKKDLQDEKIKEKLNNETKKSKHRQKLEQKYIEQGMSQEEAEIAAYKRARTEKIIAIAAGTAIAAAAAYVAYKHYDKNVDKIIKPGMTMHNISTNSNKGVKDAFYAANNGLDRLKYRGIYGAQQLNGLGGNKIYDTAFKATSQMKVASEKSGLRALQHLVSTDPEYRNALKSYLKENKTAMLPAIERGYEDLAKGKVTPRVFDAVNTLLVDHSEQGSKMSSKFYDGLKKMGYDAIVDIHDKKNSGYKSINPYIVFNGASKLSVDSVKNLSVSQLAKDARTATGLLTAQTMLPGLARNAAIVGGAVGAYKVGSKASQSQKDNAFVQKYRKEHPNTKLSYNEILRFERDK